MLIFVLLFVAVPSLRYYDPFSLMTGYTMLWLMILYILGGCIRRFNWFESVTRKKALLVFCGSLIFTLLSKLIFEYATKTLFGEPKEVFRFISYTSPTIIANGIVLLMLFAKTNFKNNAVKSMIRVLSKAALGVYLIHVNVLVYDNIIKGSTASFANLNFILMLLCVIAYAAAIYIICLLIDLARIQLFKILPTKAICEKIVYLCKRIVH